MKQVVVTGIGVITSLGSGVDEFWSSLKAGKSGISSISRFDASDIASQVASEVKLFNPEEFMDAKRLEETTVIHN